MTVPGLGGRRRVDLAGQRFGMLVAIERGEPSRTGSSRWWCVCDCGERRLVGANNLQQGGTSSCGCRRNQIRGEFVRKHRTRACPCMPPQPCGTNAPAICQGCGTRHSIGGALDAALCCLVDPRMCPKHFGENSLHGVSRRLPGDWCLWCGESVRDGQSFCGKPCSVSYAIDVGCALRTPSVASGFAEGCGMANGAL